MKLLRASVAIVVFVVLSAAAASSAPAGVTGSHRLFLRTGSGGWEKTAADCRDGRLILTLDPAKLHSGDVMLLINPPPAMAINDFTGPRLVSAQVGGKPVAAGAVMDLGNLKQPPASWRPTFADDVNALSPTGYRLLVDGQFTPVRAAWLTRQGDRQVAISVPLPRLDYGKHEVSLTATDASPQANPTTAVLRFNYIETGNLALAALGAKAAVDSCFSGYESLAALNDGVTTMPGDHCQNDISWASAEVAADHWAQITFARPTSIKEVTVYWSAYTNQYHTPRHFQIQVPDGQNWKTVYASPAEGELSALLTTARFPSLTTTSFRVFMPKGEGPAHRPNLLWIGEIKAR